VLNDSIISRLFYTGVKLGLLSYGKNEEEVDLRERM